MPKISYVNGEYVEHKNACVNIEDRGYVFSDGVYEVALYKKGVLIDWLEHMNRLQYSLNGLKINFKSMSELESIAIELINKNKIEDAVIYLQITRGVAPRLHQFPSKNTKPSIIMTVSNYNQPNKEFLENGARAITAPDLRWKLRNYKTISLLPNTLAKQEAFEKNAEEAILYEEDGKVTEGSSTNVFMVDENGCIFTHPADSNILGGITRKGVLQVALEGGIKIKEEAFSIESLKSASEVFITSTTKHVLPITSINEIKVGDGYVGKVTKNIMELYSKYIDKQL
jgi:D-alanine transaminase